jgi:ABC-type spermidine/putrescine transport system permease subunit II
MFAIGLYTIALRIHLTGTEIGVALAHAIAALPVAYLAFSAALSRYNENFDRAASSLGASRSARFISIRLPLLMPGLIAAIILSLLVSFDEVIMTLFVAGTDVQTVALRMWSSAIQSAGPELAVPSTLLLVVTGIAVIVVFAKMGGPVPLTKRAAQ